MMATSKVFHFLLAVLLLAGAATALWATSDPVGDTYLLDVSYEPDDDPCVGCHDVAPPWDPAGVPVIEEELAPSASCPDSIIIIRGSNFGDYVIPGERMVLATPNDAPDWPNAEQLPIYSWDFNRIEVRFPGLTFVPGNYRVAVHNESGRSNYKVFSLLDCGVSTSINPDSGPCGTMVFLEQLDSSFIPVGPIAVSSPQLPGCMPANPTDPTMYVTGVVDFVATEGTYTALAYKRWNSWQIRVYFQNFYEDQERFGQGLEYRNFVQDTDEPTIAFCEIPGLGGGPMGLGDYSVFIRYIFFVDNSSEGTPGVLDQTDTIYQVSSVDPKNFELANVPVLFKTDPVDIADGGPGARVLMKLYGLAFGSTPGGEVFCGSEAQYDTDTGRPQTQIRYWSNTRIKFKVNTPWCGTQSCWVDKRRGVWVVNSEGHKTRWLRFRVISP